MCWHGLCVGLSVLGNVALAAVLYFVIRKAGFSARVARWVIVIPVVFVGSVVVTVAEVSKAGLFKGPQSLGFWFDVFGYVAPFVPALVLFVFLRSEWPIGKS